MLTRHKIIIVLILILIAGTAYFSFNRSNVHNGKKAEKQIDLNNTPKQSTANTKPLNPGDVSPIAGLPCENKTRRPIAAMQPSDVTARPAAGFSDADMVFEMPVWTGGNTRLMGVYQCTIPKEIGSLRSARHDYIPLAKGLDAVFVHWGYSHFAQTLLQDRKVIDNIDCLTTSFCARWPKTGAMRLEDTGHITKDAIDQAMQKYGYKTTTSFVGYPHQEDLPLDQRPTGGHLRVAFPNPFDVEYDYDRDTNSYLRVWNEKPDTDKSNQKRVSPKNVVVMFSQSEQITLQTDYAARGVQSPWDLVPEEDRAGINGVPGAPNIGRYNNMQIGDPWFDTSDGGDAYFYMNGQQTKGTWKKDKSSIDSKLTFFDESGDEIKFVPGEIWVEVLEPGETLKWEPGVQQ